MNPLGGSDWQKPPKQTGNGLNLIVIVADTFRADNLACYGPQMAGAPGNAEPRTVLPSGPRSLPMPMPSCCPLSRCAARSTRDAEAFPLTISLSPRTCSCRAGTPSIHEDVTLSETLLEAGYVNALISSLYHQFKPGRNFHRGFHTWQWIRGLEYDFYGTSPHHPLGRQRPGIR